MNYLNFVKCSMKCAPRAWGGGFLLLLCVDAFPVNVAFQMNE